MDTRITFRIDEKLKKKFQQKLEREGISASDFCRFVLKAYAAGKIEIVMVNGRQEIRWLY